MAPPTASVMSGSVVARPRMSERIRRGSCLGVGGSCAQTGAWIAIDRSNAMLARRRAVPPEHVRTRSILPSRWQRRWHRARLRHVTRGACALFFFFFFFFAARHPPGGAGEGAHDQGIEPAVSSALPATRRARDDERDGGGAA